MPMPLGDYSIRVGGTYWSAFGDKRWSAVRVIGLGYRLAKVERVKPHNQVVIHRKGKARRDEMLPRDPAKKGKDKPTELPSVVFTRVREMREEDKAKRKEKKEEPVVPEPQPKPAPRPTSESRQLRIAELLGLLDDDSTTDDW